MGMEADIDVMLADSEVSVVFGSFSGKCLEDVADQDMLGNVTSALGEVRVITIRTAAFPGLVVGSTVSISGSDQYPDGNYKITDRKRVADGRLTLCALGNP